MKQSKTAFCDGGQISDNPYADVCGDNTVNQQRFCGLANNADAGNCPATIVSACDVETGNPFGALCSDNDDHRKTRAEACLAGDKDNDNAAECSVAVVTCNSAPFGAGV